MGAYKHRKKREYKKAKCHVCGVIQGWMLMWFRGEKWWCRKCAEAAETAGTFPPQIMEYELNGKKVSKEEYEKAVSRWGTDKSS